MRRLVVGVVKVEERVALRVPVQDAHLAARRRGEGVGVGFPGAGAAEEERRDREPQRAAARAAAGAVDHRRGEFTTGVGTKPHCLC